MIDRLIVFALTQRVFVLVLVAALIGNPGSYVSGGTEKGVGSFSSYADMFASYLANGRYGAGPGTEPSEVFGLNPQLSNPYNGGTCGANSDVIYAFGSSGNYQIYSEAAVNLAHTVGGSYATQVAGAKTYLDAQMPAFMGIGKWDGSGADWRDSF